MASPSVSLVESLIGAIPFEEGAALVARVGERATITARSGSIEVGSVALTVEAMDDLIAQVLPPDQLESLQENGTVHFQFKSQLVSGDFAVLAASTPGDRWLEIRRRSTTTAQAAAVPGADRPAAIIADIPATVSPTPVTAAAPAPAPAATPVPVANDADVAQLLSRFQAPETASTLSWDPEPAPIAQPPAFASSFTAPEPLLESDFDLDIPARVSTIEPRSQQPLRAVAPPASTNDDLTIPANLAFPEAKSEFDLDGLTLPETIPPPNNAYRANARLADVDSDHIQIGEPRTSGMDVSQIPASTTARKPRRSVVALATAVLGLVVLAAVGWFAAERYLSTPSAAVATPPPAPPRTPQPKAAANTLPANNPRTVTTAPGAAVAQKTANTSVPKPAPALAVAKASAETATTPKPVNVPPPAPVTAPAIAKPATPAATATRDGYAVQVAAVIDRSEADRIVARLVSEGYSGYAIRGEGSAAGFIRVRVGAFKDREAAEDVAARLERSEGVKPWIVKETP